MNKGKETRYYNTDFMDKRTGAFIAAPSKRVDDPLVLAANGTVYWLSNSGH